MAKNTIHNPIRVLVDVWLARFGSAFAWVCLVFWALMGLVGLGEWIDGKATETVDVIMPFFCLGLSALHVLMIHACRKTKKLVEDFRLYCAVLAGEPDKSLTGLAAALNIPPQNAVDRVQKMCRRGYFNGYIDHQRQALVFSHEEQNVSVVCCPGCGACSAIARTGDKCRYCDAPLEIPKRP